MVSDFIDEHNGCLALTEDEHAKGLRTYPHLKRQARAYLEYGVNQEGYWTSERFMHRFARGWSRFILVNIHCPLCFILSPLGISPSFLQLQLPFCLRRHRSSTQLLYNSLKHDLNFLFPRGNRFVRKMGFIIRMRRFSTCNPIGQYHSNHSQFFFLIFT